MKRNRTWHGIDASTEESLFEYGSLIRWNSKNQSYDVILKVGNDFYFETWDAANWRRMFQEGERSLKGIIGWTEEGLTEEDYLDQTDDATLLMDITFYYGLYEILDYYHQPYSESEIRKRLNKALY